MTKSKMKITRLNVQETGSFFRLSKKFTPYENIFYDIILRNYVC